MGIEVVVQKNCELGEGVWWDRVDQSLLWFDGFGRELYRYIPLTKQNDIFSINSRIGCVIPTMEDGVLLMCLEDGVYLFNTEQLTLHRISDVESKIKNNRLNDGACDSSGTLWFGSMSMTANQPDRTFEYAGAFYSLTSDGELKKHFDGVGISNGVAFNETETLLYHVDSPTQQVFSYDLDIEKKELSNKKAIITIPENEGIPDGMTIDCNGMLWIAHFGGGRVSRWNPLTGMRISEVQVPATNVTCCCFGGNKLNELYITTAREGLGSAQLENEPYAGSLFRIQLGIEGRESCRFGVKQSAN